MNYAKNLGARIALAHLREWAGSMFYRVFSSSHPALRRPLRISRAQTAAMCMDAVDTTPTQPSVSRRILCQL
jgi:hypothetical protein